MSATTLASNDLPNLTCSAKNRLFYSIPASDDLVHTDAHSSKEESSKHDLLAYINDSIIGCDKTFSGPFGLRKGTRPKLVPLFL